MCLSDYQTFETVDTKEMGISQGISCLEKEKPSVSVGEGGAVGYTMTYLWERDFMVIATCQSTLQPSNGA